MKVSILIPTRNRADFLRDAVNSVLAETAPLHDVEILVSDNASSDNTRQVLEEFRGTITAFHQEQDLGMVGNWNFLMEKAQGDFVKLMSDDDVLLPGGLVREIAALESDAVLALVSSARFEGNPPLGNYLAKPESWGGKLKQIYPVRYRLNPQDAFREMIYRENIFGTPASVLFRKAALPRFPSGWAYAVDWAGWIEALDHGSALILPEPNCIFRIHATNLTKSFLESDQDLIEVLALRKLALDRLGGNLPLSIYLLFVSLYRWGRRLLRKSLALRAN